MCSHYCDDLNCILPHLRNIEGDTFLSALATKLEGPVAKSTSIKSKRSLAEIRLQNMKALARTVSEEQKKHDLTEHKLARLKSKKTVPVKATQAKPVRPYDQRLCEVKRRKQGHSKSAFSLAGMKQSSFTLDTSVEMRGKDWGKILDTTTSDISKSMTMDYSSLDDTSIVDQKMHDIEAKFARSELLRTQELLKTQTRASKTRGFKRPQSQACLLNSSFDSHALAVRLITKQQEAAQRRTSLKNGLKRQSSLKMSLADALAKKEQALEQKTRQVEQRLRLADMQVSLKKKATLKDLDLKLEANRQRDSHTSENQSKQVGVRKNRRIQILTRHICQAKQLEELKSKRQMQATGVQDYRIQSMIEKEVYKELQCRIIKSPNSKLALSILKEFS